MKRSAIYLFGMLAFCISCRNGAGNPDASGVFEATETIISAEANGRILSLSIEEGDELQQGQEIGYIDSTQLYLSKMQLLQNRKAVLSAKPEIQKQLESLQRELQTAKTDRERMAALLQGGVASQKQMDDADSRVAVIEAKMDALRSTLRINTTSINEQGNTVAAQLSGLNDQLSKCRIVNPLKGTVFVKYAEVNEMASVGKPLYKIADLRQIILRAYVTNAQLAEVKMGQAVSVLCDSAETYRKIPGKITWISSKAEFTPKTIQTKEERANLVYAVKILVNNDGRLKPGMFADVNF